MKRNLLISALLLFLAFTSCERKCTHTPSNQEDYGSSDYLINATLWVQHSGELRASFFQAFNIAKIALQNNLDNYIGDKTPAIVFDLDETLLDNSFYEADLILNQTSYNTDNWKEWTDKKCATATPGAIDFVEFASSFDVEIIYVSNRRTDEINSTFENMKALGFPEVPIENYIFRDAESSKITRRSIISENYEIILLLGDNLNDFDGVFENRNDGNGWQAVDDNKELFGTKYIVFPNPMYGNWERPLLSNEEQSPQQNRIQSLISSADICK